jgi:hypothetical protein
MANCSQLPTWVSSLQALAVPLIAAVGLWIAARQAPPPAGFSLCRKNALAAASDAELLISP